MSIYEFAAYSVLYIFLVSVLAMRFVDEDLKQAKQFFKKHWKDVSNLDENVPHYANRIRLMYDVYTLVTFVLSAVIIYVTLTYPDTLPFVLLACVATEVYIYVLSKTDVETKRVLFNTEASTYHYISCYMHYLYDYQLMKRQAAIK